MKTLHLILTNECNAYTLQQRIGSPGVCKFCYRQTNKIETDPIILDKIFERIREEGRINEIVITGGEPLLSPYFYSVVERSNLQGLYTTIHTNGIILGPKLYSLRGKVSCISLPLDGSTADIQDYFRGIGFYVLAMRNIKEVKENGFDIGINTFVSEKNLRDIENIADIVSSLSPRYWLLSQYRKINLAQRVNESAYYSDPSEFEKVVEKIRERFPGLNLFSLQSEQKSYPERIWVQANGRVYTDLTNNSQNICLGSLLDESLEEFIKKIKQLKLKERGD